MDIRRLARFLAVAALAAALAACGRSDPAALIASAKSNLAKGDVKTAVIELKNALQSAPQNPEARFLLAKSLLETGDPVGAETEARKALELKYSTDEAWPVLARALLAQGEYRKLVTESADRTLESPQSKAEVLTSIALARLALGDKKEAREAAEAASRMRGRDVRVLATLAQVAAADNDVQTAMTHVEAALAVAPDDVGALFLKSELQIAMGKRDEGIQTLEHLLKVKPEMSTARFALVAILAGAGQADKAAAQLEPAKKAAPQDPRVRYAEAQIAYTRGDMQAAREALQAVLSAAPESVPALYLSGIVNYRLESYVAAEEALRAVVAKAPANTGARRTLAAIYLRNGRTAQALEMLEPALKMTPDDPALLRAAAEVNLASNNPAKAAELYERASALDKSDASSRVRLAQVRLASGGDAELALKELENIANANPALPAADLALVSAHLRRRETDQALAAANAFEKKQPQNPLVYNVKGVVFLAKRDFAGARASFDQALKLDPGYTAAIYNLAQLDIIQRNADSARKRYEQVLAKDPRNEQALLSLAGLLVLTHAPEPELKAAFDRAIAANPASVRARLALVNHYAQQRDSKAALVAAQAANVAIPDNPQILDVLGGAQHAAGEANQSLETLGRAVKLQPDNAMLLVRLAAAQATVKDYDSAIATLRKAVTMQPGLTAGWLALGSVYVAADRVEAGFADARRIQKEQPARAAGYALEAMMLINQKKHLDAAKALREALAREPVPALAVSLYSALIAGGKADQAAVMAQRWQKEFPKDVTLRSVQSQQAMAAKDYKTAVPHLRAILEVEPDNIVALNNLAWVLHEMGDPKAIEYADRAATLAPYAPSVMDTQAWILVAQGKNARGVELLRNASGLAPQDADIRLHLAKALIKTGDKAAAKAELEKLAVDTKASPARAEAQKMLKEM